MTLSIGMVAASLSRKGGGLFETVRAMTIGLRQLGHEVGAYGLLDGHCDTDLAAWPSGSATAFPFAGPAAFGYSRSMTEALLHSSHDLLHLHGLWQHPSVAVGKWRGRTNRPVVIAPSGMLDPWALRNSRMKKRLAGILFENRNLAAADCLHALCESEATAMRALGLRNPIAIIPNGVAIADLADLPPRPGWMRDDRRTMLFLGRIHPKKGLAETLEAWSLFKRQAASLAANWRLAIAGWDDGGHLEKLQALAETLGLHDDVVFPGPLFGPAKAAALGHADAFVLASHSEGLPMAALEAWSYRLPLFMTDACNLPEGFKAGAAIRITTEPAEIARCFSEYLGGSLAGIAGAGRKLAISDFAWPSVCAKLEAVYSWLTGAAGQPDTVRLSGEIQKNAASDLEAAAVRPTGAV